MKTIYSYGAAVFAFAATTWAFASGAFWPGALSAIAGILAIGSVITSRADDE